MGERRPWTCLMFGVFLSGCVSVIEGTSQNISVATNPSGAMCAFEQQGTVFGSIDNTPGTLKVRKTKYDIMIRCNKSGYKEAIYLNHSGVSATIAANVAADLLLTAGISSIVDSSTGADNKYDGAVNISLIPDPQASIAASASAAPINAIPADKGRVIFFRESHFVGSLLTAHQDRR